MKVTNPKPVVFTAQSKRFYYCRDAICEFVLKRGCVPLNPFRVFDYFLGDRVPRNLVRQGNFNLIRVSEELWVFGLTVANGVLEEIKSARALEKPLKFITIATSAAEIKEVQIDRVRFESEIASSSPDRRAIEAILASLADDSQLKLFE